VAHPRVGDVAATRSARKVVQDLQRQATILQSLASSTVVSATDRQRRIGEGKEQKGGW
jgi:hypothetical protein